MTETAGFHVIVPPFDTRHFVDATAFSTGVATTAGNPGSVTQELVLRTAFTVSTLGSSRFPPVSVKLPAAHTEMSHSLP